jgi:large conductance mechanosensitive channel
MKNFIQEFKKFVMRGNVIDLAVGIIVGGGFQKIITSLVNDVVMPVISPVLGVVDFKDLKLGNVLIGNFISATLDFIILAFFVFLIVKGVNSLKREKDQPQNMNKEEELLTEIRDLLKNK